MDLKTRENRVERCSNMHTRMCVTARLRAHEKDHQLNDNTVHVTTRMRARETKLVIVLCLYLFAHGLRCQEGRRVF